MDSLLQLQIQSTSLLTLSHNLTQTVFEFLTFKEIVALRITNKQLNQKVIMYFTAQYLPKRFPQFDLNQEQSNLDSLKKRVSSTPFSIPSVATIEQIEKQRSAFPNLIEAIYNFFNILAAGASSNSENRSSIFTPIEKSNDVSIQFNREKFAELQQNFNSHTLSNELIEDLQASFESINLPVINAQLRQIAIIIRSFAQLIMTAKASKQIEQSCKDIYDYEIIMNCLSSKL